MSLRTKPEIQIDLLNSTIKTLTELKPEDIVESCLTCQNFNEDTEQCGLYFARPPARVIAFGCPSYFNIEDDIPF